MLFRIFRPFCLIALLSFCVSLHARMVRDTLRLNYNEMVVFEYDLQVNNDVATIEFRSPIIKVNSFPKGVELRDVKVVFFDKKNNFGDVELDNDGITDPFIMSMPDGVDMENTNRKNGYYILNDKGLPVKLTLRLKSDNSINLQIPIYLAQYKEVKKFLGKNKSVYLLFQSLDNLVVPLQKVRNTSGKSPSPTPHIVPRTITVTDSNGQMGQGGFEPPIPDNPMPSLQDDTQALKNEMETLQREISSAENKEKLEDLRSKLIGIGVAVENVPSLRGQYSQLQKAFDSQERLIDQICRDERIREMIAEMSTLQLNIEDAKSSDQLEEYKKQMNALAPKVKEVGGEVESRFNLLTSQYDEKEKAVKKQSIWRYVLYGILGLLGIILMMCLGFIKRKIRNKDIWEMMNGVESEARRMASNTGRPSSGNGLSSIKGRFADRMRHQAEWTLRGKVDKAVNSGFSKAGGTKKTTPSPETPPQKSRTPGSTNRSAKPPKDEESPRTPNSPKTPNKGTQGKNNRRSI